MISILLASYNGEKFIAEQLDSIISQTVKDVKVYICDDCSTDNTFSIAQHYASQYPDKIFISQNEKNLGGAKHNFIEMMINIKDDYVMLCDQDDVWLPDKIEITLAEMIKLEAEFGFHAPLLVHTDLRVVGEDLATVISPSFKEAMNANYNRTKLRDQLIQNTLTGCTVMYNRSLANLIDNKPEFMVMHDWWLMLVAVAFGKIGHVDKPTVLYRQHGSNEIGAKDVRKFSYKINRLLNRDKIKEAINNTYPQAESLLNAYDGLLSEEQKSLVRQYCSIPQMGKIDRWRTVCKLGTFKNGLSRNVAYFMFI